MNLVIVIIVVIVVSIIMIVVIIILAVRPHPEGFCSKFPGMSMGGCALPVCMFSWQGTSCWPSHMLCSAPCCRGMSFAKFNKFTCLHELRTKFRLGGTYRGLYRVLGETY